MSKALILFAHGSKKLSWKEPFEYLLNRINKQDLHVELCFLDIMQPSLNKCIQDLAEKKFTHIIIAPIFLGKGRHIEKDLPELVKYNQQLYSTIEFTILPSLGERQNVLDAICKDIHSQI